MKPLFYLTVFAILVSCNSGGSKAPDDVKVMPPVPAFGYSVVNTFPHDTSSYTEGLLIYKDNMYESTGEFGKSKLIQVDAKTGKAIRKIDLDSKYFGEGISIIRDTVYQLTYQTKVVFVYTLKDFKKIKEFTINTEGWGMTTDGKELIASDGSSYLYYYDPSTFHLLRKQEITEAGSLSYNLNELEYIDGYIYANQWQQPYIFKIDPASGQIVAKADFSEITNRIKAKYPTADVMNGIAYDPSTKKIYITGKYWPDLYEVQFSK
ncbi:MAG: glutaminyl-peptide cyclotransferase [Bacteroidota bacterium]|nr:glutaminyl-peptide cyclotransferase [Bacteroidota bacterium]